MKRLILLIGLLLFCTLVLAPEYRCLSLPKIEPINPYESIIDAVVTVESKGDNMAYNDKEGAVGAFQVRLVRLQDYNRRTGKNLCLQECYDYETGRMIFMYYASQYDYRDVKAICRSWNGRSVKNKYYYKVKKLL